jgi:hypothetical protein
MTKAAPMQAFENDQDESLQKAEAIVIHASLHGGGIDPKKMDVHTAMGLPMIGHW